MRKLFAKLHFPAQHLNHKGTETVKGPADSKRNHRRSGHGTTTQPSSEPRVPRPALETLPAELRAHILSLITDLSDLRAVVHASPILYQQYLLDQRRLLGQALSATLESNLVDAYMLQSMTALAIASREMSGRDAQQAITRLFREYDAELRAGTGAATVLQRCSTEDLASIASFYLSVARPALCSCATLFLQNLKGSPEPGALSERERIRLLRALYRFQFFQELLEYLDRAPRFVKGEVLGAFFAVFHPWEVEEMNCVDLLVRGLYKRIFTDAIKWRFYKRKPDNTERALLLDGAVARGLKGLRRVLESADRKGLVEELMQNNRAWRVDQSIPTSLPWVTQTFSGRHYHLDTGLPRDTYELLRFSGDERDAPIAWALIWKGTYGNIYEEVLPVDLKAWGYVLWDARRLVGTEAEQELRRAVVFNDRTGTQGFPR